MGPRAQETQARCAAGSAAGQGLAPLPPRPLGVVLVTRGRGAGSAAGCQPAWTRVKPEAGPGGEHALLTLTTSDVLWTCPQDSS